MAETISIGMLDRKITIQTYTVAVSTSGERVKTWATFASVWAKVDYSGGNKSEEDDKITAVNDMLFTIRWIDNIETNMRVVYDGEYYTIRSMKYIGRKNFIELETDTRLIES